MSKSKKVTYKELMERNDFLLSRLMQVEKAVDYMHTLLIDYIDCNGDQEKLKQFLEEVTKDGQSNTSDIDGNRENKPGNTSIDTESSEVGGKSEAPTNTAQAE